MERYGDLFPDRPANLEELVDQLARRAMAAQRLMSSLSAEQRDELAGLMDQALSDAGLAAEMARLADALRARRPEIDMAGWQRESMTGDDPLGLGDATTALADLADLADLEAALGQDYPGASLDDIDEESIRRSLGRQAVDDMEALRQIERELERQGYLQRTAGRLELTPKAVRRLGETALRQIFADLPEGRFGDHDQRDAGQAGERTGATRPWQFGDEQAIDTPATVRNALLRDATAIRDRAAGGAGQESRGRAAPPSRPFSAYSAAKRRWSCWRCRRHHNVSEANRSPATSRVPFACSTAITRSLANA